MINGEKGKFIVSAASGVPEAKYGFHRGIMPFEYNIVDSLITGHMASPSAAGSITQL